MEAVLTRRELAEEVGKGNPSPQTPLPPVQGVAGAQMQQPAPRLGERGLGLSYPARLLANSCKAMTRGDKC